VADKDTPEAADKLAAEQIAELGQNAHRPQGKDNE